VLHIIVKIIAPKRIGVIVAKRIVLVVAAVVVMMIVVNATLMQNGD
tara:strand:- start:144 stop:281 length:138 start_codon:yes stop_codon:yes gene_type:complete